MSYFIDKRRQQLGRAIDRHRLKNKTFTLISNDCWGAQVYKHFNLPFNTPFINLMLAAPCYLKLASAPQHYLGQPLEFQAESRYESINTLRRGWKHYFPIATLGGEVEIQFLHYHSDEEAKEKWTRRVKRINWENIFFKFDGSKDFATPELVQQFDQLTFPRLTLLREPQPGIKSAVVVPDYITDGFKLFERSLPHFDLVGWLNGGDVHVTPGTQLYKKVFFPKVWQ
ncbi:DUF1919 domain-containing protein [Hymenobacter chitinivorans]|uniref:Uncharacterized protein (DUF1919 family) n=1 Tax=Hymenobacter chitinivorans DSM 11115 TaxID=1121954 RepID=A0A2M9BL61_9BACT|nr:DUF1919 domain-containing protein [Hymenobacter chitinivorans]PJJ58684.1 uncharacterized protein (DUF1919 family) [Hymenobacter chitinivorans DSM 11115]